MPVWRPVLVHWPNVVIIETSAKTELIYSLGGWILLQHRIADRKKKKPS